VSASEDSKQRRSGRAEQSAEEVISLHEQPPLPTEAAATMLLVADEHIESCYQSLIAQPPLPTEVAAIVLLVATSSEQIESRCQSPAAEIQYSAAFDVPSFGCCSRMLSPGPGIDILDFFTRANWALTSPSRVFSFDIDCLFIAAEKGV